MNKHELRGDARYVGGKIEKAVGDLVDRRDWKVAGVADQVAGGAEHLLGRAQSVGQDIADMTPSLIEHARETLGDAADRSVDKVRRGTVDAGRIVRERPPVLWGLAAAAAGYALGWLIHGRRG